ncbi:MAG TPA: tetratricopeptide repeat protein [Thermoanaerobaculia bacterium]|nr:tetratricopeptide repeat protein [Thermoanaerobaculia bacterium]
MSGHYDEGALQEYLDDPESFPQRNDLETHLLICAACRAAVEELRAFEAALSTESVWNAVNEEPPDSMRALAERLESEDAEAEQALAPYLGSPAAFRRANVATLPRMRTAGVVRRLCAEARALRDRQPMHALYLADAAIAIGEQLPHELYPAPVIDELRGWGWLERANVLRHLGRHAEALDALDIASRAFTHSPVAAYSLALADYLRGVIFVELERLDEGLRLVRRSARVFRQFGEDERYVHAKIIEAGVLFDRSRYRDARDLLLSLVPVAKEIGQARTLAHLYGNIANCQLRLHDLESAEVYFGRALSLYEALGIEIERVRTRWNIGCLRIAAGNIDDGMTRLRQVRAEFERLGMRSDAALVTLDLAEALLATGTPANAREAAALATSLVTSFTEVGMTGSALTALAFLREAFDSGQVTPKLVRHVRDFLESRPDQRDVRFVPPL